MDLSTLKFPVIAVGGTNGKGSVVAMLESIYLAAGYSVAAYTSPHLMHYRERVRLNGISASDKELVAGFENVDNACDDVMLTYFEYGTLAAVDIFRRSNVDLAILEVGLGGRLDAVNAFDADAAVITSIAIDHVEWLGHDRESIGFEKAGIFRPGRPAICGDADPPVSMETIAHDLDSDLYVRERDFSLRCDDGLCRFIDAQGEVDGIRPPQLYGKHQLDNMATALKTVHCLADRLPVTTEVMNQGLQQVSLPGRYQRVAGLPPVILDVAHNPEATHQLAAMLREDTIKGETIAVVGMMSDKALAECLRPLLVTIDRWYVADLPPPRGARAGDLSAVLKRLATETVVEKHENIESAFASARVAATAEDRIVVFGSFVGVGVIMQQLS